MPQPILVIKLGALGDFVQALDALAAIRAHHAGDELVLMTTAPFAELARRSGWFDRVWIDPREPWWRPDIAWARRRRFAAERFARAYDLQCSPRTARYRALCPQTDWVGSAGPMHASNRAKIAAQLASRGLPEPPPADLGWLDADIGHLNLPPRYALLIPGCGPRKLAKRWEPARYGALAEALAGQGLPSVLVGTEADRDAIDGARAVAPDAIDLCGRTGFFELAAVARRAALAVGNDTGTTFLASALGTPTLMLMSRETDPVVSAPWGPGAAWLRREALRDLSVDEVLETMASAAPAARRDSSNSKTFSSKF